MRAVPRIRKVYFVPGRSNTSSKSRAVPTPAFPVRAAVVETPADAPPTSIQIRVGTSPAKSSARATRVEPAASTAPIPSTIRRRRFVISNPLGVASGDRHVLAEVDVLDRVQQLDSILHRPLKRFPPRDEAHPAGPLVDHRGRHRLGEVVGPR